MKCPECGNHMVPFKVWLISRWSSVECNKCGTRSGRNMNLQFWIIFFLIIFPLAFLNVNFFSPIFIIWAIIVMFIDAYTVKLIPQGKKPS